MTKEKVVSVINKLRDLPSSSLIVKGILETIENPQSSMEDLNKIISKDQALTAKILRLVNSAFYGFPKKINTLTQASVILGFNTIKSLCMSILAYDVFKKQNRDFQGYFYGIWEHALGVATCSKYLASQKLPSLKEECFIAGLLHDIGILIIEQFFYSDFLDALILADYEGTSLYNAEKAKYEVNHCTVGEILAHSWNIPDNLKDCISHHHELEKANNFDLVAIVHTADILCKLKKIGGCGDERNVKFKDIHPMAKKYLNLNDNNYIPLLLSLDSEIVESDGLYKIMFGEKPTQANFNKKENSERKKVLIIDDSSSVRDIVRNVISTEGYRLIEAENGQEGINILKHTKPDLILLDIVMPEMDGFKVLENLKSNPETKDIPVVMLTVKTQKEAVEKAVNLGCNAYIAKPFISSTLMKKINEMTK